MTEPEQQPTQHDDWALERDRGQKLHNMLQHPGWTEVLAPDMKNHKMILQNKLLYDKMTKAEEFIFVRQSILACDSVITLIKTILAIGEKAAENLKKETEE